MKPGDVTDSPTLVDYDGIKSRGAQTSPITPVIAFSALRVDIATSPLAVEHHESAVIVKSSTTVNPNGEKKSDRVDGLTFGANYDLHPVGQIFYATNRQKVTYKWTKGASVAISFANRETAICRAQDEKAVKKVPVIAQSQAKERMDVNARLGDEEAIVLGTASGAREVSDLQARADRVDRSRQASSSICNAS